MLGCPLSFITTDRGPHHTVHWFSDRQAPLLLLPENIRIRKFNLQAETFHDFLEEEEHIMALDYDFDHNNTGFSRSHTD